MNIEILRDLKTFGQLEMESPSEVEGQVAYAEIGVSVIAFTQRDGYLHLLEFLVHPSLDLEDHLFPGFVFPHDIHEAVISGQFLTVDADDQIAPLQPGCIGRPVVHQTVYIIDARGRRVPISISTEDGSVGTKGMITSLVETDLKKWTEATIVYACGPLAMLRTITEFSVRTGCTCWISLEERMACGVGACFGCVVLTVEGYKRVCKEGPVFDANEIVWDHHG